MAPDARARGNEATKEASYEMAWMNFKRGEADYVPLTPTPGRSQAAIPAHDALLVYLEASRLSSFLGKQNQDTRKGMSWHYLSLQTSQSCHNCRL